MEHSTLLCDIDLLTPEHGIDALAQTRRLCQFQEQLYRFISYTVLRIVKVDANSFERETLEHIKASSENTSAIDQLHSFLARLIDWTEEHTQWLGVIADQSNGPRRGSGRCGPIYRWLHGVVEYLLRQAVATGQANIDDTVYAADVILSAVDVDLYVFQRHERHYSPAQIRAGLHQLVEGLRNNRPAA